MSTIVNSEISISLYRVILDNSSDPIFCFARNGKYLYVNNAFAAPFKIPPMEIIGKVIWDIFPGNEGDLRFAAVKHVFETGEKKVIEVKVQTETELLYFMTSVIPVRDANGDVENVICISKDITDRKLAEEALKESEARLLAAQAMAHVGSWELDLATGEVWASPETFRIYGIEQAASRLPLAQVQACVLADYRVSLDHALTELIAGNAGYDVEFKIRKASNGEECFVHTKAILVTDTHGRASRVVGTMQDITERKKKEADILYLSYHDQLTGLFNRRFYEQELVRLDSESNLPLTIVMSDVNGLKLVNDSLGHSLGDTLLRKVAEVMNKGFRPDDVVARLGGDEFVAIMPRTDSRRAEQIVSLIKEMAATEGVGPFQLSIALGHGTKDTAEQSIQEVFKQAEDRMYIEKICRTVQRIDAAR